MPGMTAEQRNILLECIKQWGESQERIQGEKNHQDAVSAKVMDELRISEKHFKVLARAHWRDTVQEDREDAEAQADLFALAKGANVYGIAREGAE